jgi:hypothetical protein
MRDLDNTESHLSRIDPADSSLYIFESAKGEAIERRSLALLYLGHPEAATELERVLASIDPASLSWRSYATTSLAAARARMGDPEHAYELLMTALTLAESASAPRCIREVLATRRGWSSLVTYDGPGARRFDERARTLPPSTHLALPNA